MSPGEWEGGEEDERVEDRPPPSHGREGRQPAIRVKNMVLGHISLATNTSQTPPSSHYHHSELNDCYVPLELQIDVVTGTR